MNKGEKSIIINGRKLNCLQRFIFNMGYVTIINIFKIIYIIGIFVLFALVLYVQRNVDILGVTIFVGLSLTIFIMYYWYYIEEYVFIMGNPRGLVIPPDVTGILKKSWIINWKMVEVFVGAVMRSRNNKVGIGILENSSGHTVLDRLKEDAAQNIPSMVKHIEKPTYDMICSVMMHYSKTGEVLELHRCYKFEKETIERLRVFYAVSNGIEMEDNFTTKAIKIKSKKSLLDNLKRVFKEGGK